jgi:hypothetical protein
MDAMDDRCWLLRGLLRAGCGGAMEEDRIDHPPAKSLPRVRLPAKYLTHV